MNCIFFWSSVTGWAGGLNVPAACCTHTTASAFDARPVALTVPVMLPSAAIEAVADASRTAVATASTSFIRFTRVPPWGSRRREAPTGSEGETQDDVQRVVLRLAQVALVLERSP